MRKLKKLLVLLVAVEVLCTNGFHSEFPNLVIGCTKILAQGAVKKVSEFGDSLLRPESETQAAEEDSIASKTASKKTSTYKLKQGTITVPKYNGSPYAVINDNKPFFTKKQKKKTNAFEIYKKLDDLGRCGTAFANLCPELMPTEERGEIGMVKPSGWHTVKYDCITDGKYLYNRCHLIGFQLAGENANEKNLITGTRYLNVEGMLPFENEVADYIHETGNHVLYRVTPVFKGKDLVARGVLMEAYSVEDKGEGICFNVFCYNVQPHISIRYSDGYSSLKETEK